MRPRLRGSRSHVVDSPTSVRIELVKAGGETEVLKASTELQAGEVIDSSRMSVAKLRSFFGDALKKASASDLMVSLHLKGAPSAPPSH